MSSRTWHLDMTCPLPDRAEDLVLNHAACDWLIRTDNPGEGLISRLCHYLTWVHSPRPLNKELNCCRTINRAGKWEHDPARVVNAPFWERFALQCSPEIWEIWIPIFSSCRRFSILIFTFQVKALISKPSWKMRNKSQEVMDIKELLLLPFPAKRQTD